MVQPIDFTVCTTKSRALAAVFLLEKPSEQAYFEKASSTFDAFDLKYYPDKEISSVNAKKRMTSLLNLCRFNKAGKTSFETFFGV